MFDTPWSGVSAALGLDADTLNVWQVMVRAAVVYPVGIAFVRLAEKRFIGKFTAFDVIMGILIGSILSRAITDASAFFSSLAAGLTLVVLHYLFAVLSFRSDRFGDLVKGSARTLVKNGQILWRAMRSGHISEKDLMSALRENAQVNDVAHVELARLERSGNISVILREEPPTAERSPPACPPGPRPGA